MKNKYNFRNEPLLTYTDSKEFVFAQIPVFYNQFNFSGAEDRWEDFEAYTNRLGINVVDKPSLSQMNEIQGVYTMVSNQLQRVLDRLDQLDQKILSSIENYYSDREKDDTRYNIFNQLNWLYGFFRDHGTQTEDQIKNYFDSNDIEDHTGQFCRELLHYGNLKKRIIDSNVHLAKQFLHLETLRYYWLTGKEYGDPANQPELPRFTKDDTIKYNDDNFWKTAHSMYYKEEGKSTWEQVYGQIKKEHEMMGLKLKYSTFDSFKAHKPKPNQG